MDHALTHELFGSRHVGLAYRCFPFSHVLSYAFDDQHIGISFWVSKIYEEPFIARQPWFFLLPNPCRSLLSGTVCNGKAAHGQKARVMQAKTGFVSTPEVGPRLARGEQTRARPLICDSTVERLNRCKPSLARQVAHCLCVLVFVPAGCPLLRSRKDVRRKPNHHRRNRSHDKALTHRSSVSRMKAKGQSGVQPSH